MEKEMQSVNQPWHADQLMVTEGDVQDSRLHNSQAVLVLPPTGNSAHYNNNHCALLWAFAPAVLPMGGIQCTTGRNSTTEHAVWKDPPYAAAECIDSSTLPR